MDNNGTIQGILMYKWLAYQMSENTAAYEEFDLMGRWGVDDILDIIDDTGLHKFMFDDGLYGCRYWQLMLIRMLEAKSVLPLQSSIKAFRFLIQRHQRGSHSEPHYITPGSFNLAGTQTWSLRALQELLSELQRLQAHYQARWAAAHSEHAAALQRLSEAKSRSSKRKKAKRLSAETDDAEQELSAAARKVQRSMFHIRQMQRTQSAAMRIHRERAAWLTQ